MDEELVVGRDPWPLVGIVCALGFVVVAALIAQGGSLAFDVAIASVIQGLPVPRAFWEACSRAGGGTLVLVGVAFVLVAVLTRRLRLALIVAATLIAANLFVDIVKEYVARPRPPGAALVLTSGFSFPSSHALTSTATYGLLAVVVWRSELPRRLRLIVAVLVGVALPILVGLSRIALDVHYPSDVVAGLAGRHRLRGAGGDPDLRNRGDGTSRSSTVNISGPRAAVACRQGAPVPT